MPPAPKTPPAPSTLRPVAEVEFVRPVKHPAFNVLIKRLIADKPVEIPYADRDPQLPPPMFRDSETQEILVGNRRYPIQGGVVESYELAKMAKGRAPE